MVQNPTHPREQVGERSSHPEMGEHQFRAGPPGSPGIAVIGLPSLAHPPVGLRVSQQAQPACGRPPTAAPILPGLGDCDDSRPLFYLQHSSNLGSVFGDSYYEQQMAARQANALSHQVSGRPGHSAPSKCLPGPRPPSGMSSTPCLQAGEHGAAFASPGICTSCDSERQQRLALGVVHACGFVGGQAGFMWRPGSGAQAQEGLATARSWSLTHPFIYPSIHLLIHPASPEG